MPVFLGSGFCLCLYLTQEFCTANRPWPDDPIPLAAAAAAAVEEQQHQQQQQGWQKFLSENSHSNLISPKQSQNVMSLRLERGKKVVELGGSGWQRGVMGFKRGQLRLGGRLGTFAKLHLKLW